MIVPPSLLFQFQLRAPRLKHPPSTRTGTVRLPDSCAVFVPEQLNSGATPVDLKLAWHPHGFAISIRITGKTLPVAGTPRDLKSSDHIRISIDTRHTANVHRATEYCSALELLPANDDDDGKPWLSFTEIGQQRARRHDQSGRRCAASTERLRDGYATDLWIPANQLPGFDDVAAIGQLGFYVVVNDSELGELPLSVGGDFPIAHDPSTWIEVQLLPEPAGG